MLMLINWMRMEALVDEHEAHVLRGCHSVVEG